MHCSSVIHLSVYLFAKMHPLPIVAKASAPSLPKEMLLTVSCRFFPSSLCSTSPSFASRYAMAVLSATQLRPLWIRLPETSLYYHLAYGMLSSSTRVRLEPVYQAQALERGDDGDHRPSRSTLPKYPSRQCAEFLAVSEDRIAGFVNEPFATDCFGAQLPEEA